MYLYILLATVITSLPSLLGALFIFNNSKNIAKTTGILVSLASGTLLGGAFLHLMPEGLEQTDATLFTSVILVTILVYFLLDTVLGWHHCEHHTVSHTNCDENSDHRLGIMSLVGDGVHNFIDGVLIAGAFVLSPAVGISTTVAVMLHEIPQEIGDFGVLIHAGYTKRKAALLNLAVALIAVIGGTLGYWMIQNGLIQVSWLYAIAAGSFIYISLSDLLPEVRDNLSKESKTLNSLVVIAGVGIMLLFKLFL